MSENKKTPASKAYTSTEVKKLDKSRVEITGSVPAEYWEGFRAQALKELNASIKLDGFRKGMIPENILVSKIGEMAVLEEMAELALPKAYLDILIDQNIDAIGKPAIQVTKLAKGNPLEFKATTAVVPEVKLPDYQKLATAEIAASPKEDAAPTDKEIGEAILRIRKMHASHEGHDHAKMTPEEHDKAVMENLPELNDEFVQKIGGFENVADFKTKVSGILADNKRDEAREKRRIRISDALIAKTDVELPDLLVSGELRRIESQFKDDIEHMGVKLDDYLKHAKKTIEDLRTEWRPSAEKKAKLQLILNAIAKAEKIVPDQQEIEAEAAHIIDHYKDADHERALTYAETVLTNEKVYQWLENQGK